jgi:hypothetical protein
MSSVWIYPIFVGNLIQVRSAILVQESLGRSIPSSIGCCLVLRFDRNSLIGSVPTSVEVEKSSYALHLYSDSLSEYLQLLENVGPRISFL